MGDRILIVLLQLIQIAQGFHLPLMAPTVFPIGLDDLKEHPAGFFVFDLRKEHETLREGVYHDS
jgi:hypothetical protein